jgi:hypothetical protein
MRYRGTSEVHPALEAHRPSPEPRVRVTERRVTRRAFAAAGFVSFGLAVALAKGWTAAHAGFGKGDVVPFGLWTIPFAAGAGIVALLVRRSRWPSGRVPRLVAASAAGALWGIAWTYLMAWSMGPWFGTMSVPVVWLLMMSGALGLACAEVLGANSR